MGQAILYCYRCSTQLREVHFEQGKAYRIDSWVCCAACAPEAVKSLPPDRAMSLLKAMVGPEKKPQPAAAPPGTRHERWGAREKTPPRAAARAVPRRASTPRVPAAPAGAESPATA